MKPLRIKLFVKAFTYKYKFAYKYLKAILSLSLNSWMMLQKLWSTLKLPQTGIYYA